MKDLHQQLSRQLTRWFLLESGQDQQTQHRALREDLHTLSSENLTKLKSYALIGLFGMGATTAMQILLDGAGIAQILPGMLAMLAMLGICLFLRKGRSGADAVRACRGCMPLFILAWYMAIIYYDAVVTPRQPAALSCIAFVVLPLLLYIRPADNLAVTLLSYAALLLLERQCPANIRAIDAFNCLVAGTIGVFLGQRNTMNYLAQKHYLDMYRAASKISILVVQVNLPSDSFRVLQCPDYMEKGMGLSDSATVCAGLIRDMFVSPEFREEYEKIIDLHTMAQRLETHGSQSLYFIDFRGRWCQLLLTCQRPEGRVTDFIATVRDVDEEKRREMEYQKKLSDAMEEAQRANAAKTSFLSRMTHDIRTPLNGIIGLLKINDAHQEDWELVRSNRQKMLVSANYLLSLINDMLEMSKLEDGDIILSHEIVDLRTLASDVMTIAGQRAVETGITLTYDLPREKLAYPCIYASPLHLRQIFLNIYSNCIKYNHPGGSVHTTFRCDEAQEHTVTYTWTISDTGVGMSPEFMEHIFEPFTQERVDARSVLGGTGLGMAIVKSLVEKMRGTITVESKEGVGSTFTITIPFEVAPELEEAAPAPLPHAGIHGLHLLLAEDNELNAEIAQTLLGDEGAHVTLAADGQVALQTFREAPAGTFDAILMDVMMPNMDGLEATRAIRALPREDAAAIPIIAMTANAFVEDAQRCLAAGMNAHLAKPLQMEQVISTIAGLCAHRKSNA